MVGDFNIAATPKDVNSTLDWSRMYHAEELEIMRALLRDYTDVWRVQHPDVTDQFTVWDEKTSARAFNQVSSSSLYSNRELYCTTLQP